MITLILGLIGLLAFTIGVLVLGLWLRRHPSKANAETSSRIMHFLFFAGLVTPGLISVFYPGLTRLDGLVGLPPLPWQPIHLAVGITLALQGLYWLIISNRSLRALGSGANAFRLTKLMVERDAYERTRNPMSFGYYLFSLGVGLASGSTLVTLAVLLGVIPAHLFFLKFFEEQELFLRFGEPYEEYKRSVPFLIPRTPAN